MLEKKTKKLVSIDTYKLSLWVPGRTRTVDIQNHNLTL